MLMTGTMTIPRAVCYNRDLMALNIASLVATVAVGIAAICITFGLSRKAEESLRKSTKVAALATAQVLRSIHRGQQPKEDEIANAGAPYWKITQAVYLIERGGAIELKVHQSASDSNPLYRPEDTVANPDFMVVTPTGRNFKTTARPHRLDNFDCSWWVKYPRDFPDATSDEEGLYLVECSVPDENYARLFAAFAVLT
jgi:hypothetical protein